MSIRASSGPLLLLVSRSSVALCTASSLSPSLFLNLQASKLSGIETDIRNFQDNAKPIRYQATLCMTLTATDNIYTTNICFPILEIVRIQSSVASIAVQQRTTR